MYFRIFNYDLFHILLYERLLYNFAQFSEYQKKQDIFIYDESCNIFVFFYFHVMGEQPHYLETLFSKE